MKILKIILENFSSINTAMNSKKIEIDFSNSLNKICLIIGPNGSGKTSILSLLNPFATLGNLDVRDGNDLILENKNGYKEIHIEKNEDVYIIKHFYTPNKNRSHTVKSYIQKNDIELNENGNVTSFKEIVKEELQVELEYLKLIRIGSNVTSMIGLSETERKTFMSKLLDDIGIYLTFYKKVNTDLKQLKDLISHNIDKLNKLGIENKSDCEKNIKNLQIEYDIQQESYAKITGELSVLFHQIEDIDPILTYDKIKSNNKKISKMKNILESKNKLESTDVKFYENKINKLENEVSKAKTGIETSNIIIQNYLNNINNLEEQLRILNIQYENEQNMNTELKKLNEELNKIEKEIYKIEELLEDFETSITKKEFENFVIFLKNTQNNLSKTYEFGKPPIKKIIELLRENKDISKYITKHKTMTNENDDEFINKLYRIGINKEMINDEKCDNNICTYKKIINQIINLLNDNEIEDKEPIEFFQFMELAWENIKYILSSFSKYSGLIMEMPDEIKNMFKIENIYNHIEKLEPIYDEKIINNYLSLITEYDNLQKLKNDKEKLIYEINIFGKVDNSKNILKQIKNIKNSIKENIETQNKHKNYIIEYKENIKENNMTIEYLTDCKETFEKYDQLVIEQEELNNKWNLYNQNNNKINNLNLLLNKTKSTMSSLNEKIQRLISNLDQYNELKKYLNKYNNIYDELLLVKESLSSKKGIPLHYMLTYLGNTENITNELLDIVYNGNIYIDKFNITPTEFSIPFYNKGKWLKDVKYASQGELSFLSIALSFALSSQTLSKYNIMLLDEIDGPLDTTNREKFIEILENQIERIHSEQNFLITHNEMFSSYPVDIIDLSFNTNSSKEKYPLANIISVKKY